MSGLLFSRGRAQFIRNLSTGFEIPMGSNSARTPRIQALYDHCKKVFATSGSTTPHPSSQDVAELRSLMDSIGPADVGLSEELSDDDRGHGILGLNALDRVTRWAQPITCYDIHESDSFTMFILSFPTLAVIPLHDHPGMTVFSKVLYGSVHVKAYDWVEPLGRVTRWAQPITCYDIHESDSFTMFILSFPTSAVIPLHDHPGMTVFSKVLYGSLHVKAYDWVEPASVLNKEGQAVRLARLAADRVLTAPCSTAILYPKSGGNLHCFTAITPCAVLDVLSPPYREEAGRPCNYYHDYPYFTLPNEAETTDDEEDYAWLARIGAPDQDMRSGKYSGPPVQI